MTGMSDERRLKEKLAKLAAEDVPGEARRISGASETELVRAILEEIDETMLARRVTFHADDGRKLSADVANRRLLRLVDVPGQADDSLLAPLAPGSDDVLPQIVAALRGIARGQSTLGVETAALETRTEPEVLGRSVAALARAAGIELYSEVAPVDEAAEDGLLAGISVAERVFGTTPAGPSGPQAEALADLEPPWLDPILPQLGSPGARTGRFLVLAGREPAGHALFVGCKTDDTTIAALVPSARIGDAITRWQALRAAS